MEVEGKGTLCCSPRSEGLRLGLEVLAGPPKGERRKDARPALFMGPARPAFVAPVGGTARPLTPARSHAPAGFNGRKWALVKPLRPPSWQRAS